MLSFLLAALENEADQQMFVSVYNQHHSKMESVAINILKNQSDAEDAVQNAFMQVIRHFQKIYTIPCEDLPFWLISIVKNESYMILRKRKQDIPLEDWSGFSEMAEDVSEYAALVELFAEFPNIYWLVLKMKMHTLDQQLHVHGILRRRGAPLHERKERDLYNW